MRRPLVTWAAWLALPALLPGVSGAAEPIVQRVEVRSDIEIERPDEILDWIVVEPGQPLDRQAVARSLRNLRATGIAGQVEAYRLSGDVVAFVLRGRTLVESVELEGELGLKPWQVREAVTVRDGLPLLADGVFRTFQQLRDLYELHGYLGASVRVAVEEDEARLRATVTFTIDCGDRATFGSIEFDGGLGALGPEALLGALHSKVGGSYSRTAVREDQERLETWLLRQGYRQATVGVPIEDPQGVERVRVTFPVEVGEHFTVEVAGDRGPLERRDLLPLQGTERYDSATVFETERRIRSDFQQRGYYDVAVEIAEENEEGEHTLRVSAQPGPKRSLESVSFSGNEALEDGRLRSVMQNTVRARFTPGSGVLVDLWLEEDLAILQGAYALEGFLKAQVGPAKVEQRQDGSLALSIPIVEGPRTTIGDLTLRGARQFAAEDLLPGLPLVAGGPYHPRRLEEALALVRARYADAGFNQTQVAAHSEWAEDAGAVDLRIDILEGPQSLSERIVVHGQRKTRQSYIRDILDLEPGTPLSPRLLRATQRRLYSQGIFSNVDVRVIPGTPFSAGRDVIVELEEGRNRRVTYGFGYDSEDGVRGLFGYSHRNLLGVGLSAQVDLRASERDRQARFLVQQPLVGQWDLPVTYSLFAVDEGQESFRSRRTGTQIDVDRINGRTRWGLLYTYKLVQLDEPEPGLEELLIDRRFQEVTVSSLEPSLSVDRRDDALDPQRGWNATLVTEFAFPFINAEEEFVKIFGQGSWLVGAGSRAVLVLSGRVGGIEPLSEAAEVDPVCQENGLDFASCDVKISERFFAGGRTTHRAYRRDRLGIPGETLLEVDGQDQPVAFGGTGLLIANMDFRFDIVGALGGTVFADAGNLWPDWRDIEPSSLKYGAGVGLRYASPLGPIRLEIGWKLDRLPGEDPYVVLFSVGNPF